MVITTTVASKLTLIFWRKVERLPWIEQEKKSAFIDKFHSRLNVWHSLPGPVPTHKFFVQVRKVSREIQEVMVSSNFDLSHDALENISLPGINLPNG